MRSLIDKILLRIKTQRGIEGYKEEEDPSEQNKWYVIGYKDALNWAEMMIRAQSSEDTIDNLQGMREELVKLQNPGRTHPFRVNPYETRGRNNGGKRRRK